jgi:tetratricopeptide (TPR) repeat protein
LKKYISTLILLFPLFLHAQNTIDGKKVTVPEKELDRQSAFLDAERERVLEHNDKAAEAYKNFLNDNPTNDAAWYGLARTQLALKDETASLISIKNAMSADPANYWYSMFYADLLEKGGRIKDAVKVYETIAKQNEIPEFYQKLAYLAVLSGDPKLGLKSLEQLEKMQGITEGTSINKHKIYVALGETKKAAAELDKLSKEFPEEIEFRYVLAEFYEKFGEKAEAQKVYKDILKYNPDDGIAKIALLDEGKNQNDAQFLDKLKPLFSDPKVSIDTKVKELLPYFSRLEKGNDPALIANLLELGSILEKTHPESPKSWSVSGDILYFDNQNDKALEKYKKCIQLNASVFSVWENSLEILQNTAKYSEMYTIAEKAIDAFPNQAKGYLYYGIAANELGKYDDAISLLEQATLIAGNNIGLKFNIEEQICTAYIRKKDFKTAQNRLDLAVSKGGNKHPGILECLGDIALQNGEKSKAIEFWKQAYSIRKTATLQTKING